MLLPHACWEALHLSESGPSAAGLAFARGATQGGVGVVGRGGAWAVACRAVADLSWSVGRLRPRLRSRVGGEDSGRVFARKVHARGARHLVTGTSSRAPRRAPLLSASQ